jgi:hypothetical protein
MSLIYDYWLYYVYVNCSIRTWDKGRDVRGTVGQTVRQGDRQCRTEDLHLWNINQMYKSQNVQTSKNQEA